MRYSATVAPMHPKPETPQAETGMNIPASIVKISNFNLFKKQTKFSFTFKIVF
jgi:hypothetical protein